MMKNGKSSSSSSRAPRVRKPKPATPVVAVPTSYDDVVRIAATVTPDTFGDMLRTANANVVIAHGMRNVNRFNGWRVQYTQNDLFARNASLGLTDVQLSWVWCVCFPAATGHAFDATRATTDDAMRAAIVRGASIVNGARNTFNKSGHGWNVPATPSARVGNGRVVFAPRVTVPAPRG